ncbi:hypothetical protein ACQSMR_001715 [Morganella morganii]|nr:hypothetical protein [Morganella morganii]
MIEEAPVYADGTVVYDGGIQWLYELGALVLAARYENGKLHYLVTDHQDISLVPIKQHQSFGIVQDSLHPGGKEGMNNWGGGR